MINKYLLPSSTRYSALKCFHYAMKASKEHGSRASCMINHGTSCVNCLLTIVPELLFEDEVLPCMWFTEPGWMVENVLKSFSV